MIVVVMGVCGSGKTVVGQALAAILGGRFVDGDHVHPAANVAKMAAGIPLDDDDRRPWLEALARMLGEAAQTGETVVLACSALKRAYRAILRHGMGEEGRLVWLTGPTALIAGRLAARQGHFMGAGMLESQLAALEPPSPDEALAVEITAPPDAIASSVAALLTRKRES